VCDPFPLYFSEQIDLGTLVIRKTEHMSRQSVCLFSQLQGAKMPRANKLPKIAWTDVPDSSNVNSLFYDPHTHTIAVRFNSGGLYTYMAATEEMYKNLLYANSVGSYLHRVVKALPYTRWETEEELLKYLNM